MTRLKCHSATLLSVLFGFFFLHASCKTRHPKASSCTHPEQQPPKLDFPPSAQLSHLRCFHYRKGLAAHCQVLPALKHSRMWSPHPCQIERNIIVIVIRELI